MRKRIRQPEDLFDAVEVRRAQVGVSGRTLGVQAGLSFGTFSQHNISGGGEMSLRAALGYLNALGMRMDVSRPPRRGR